MHPPPFNPTHDLLSDWPECCIEVRCICGMATMIPTRLLAAQHGNHPVGEIVWRLRCRTCKTPPAQVWLVAGLHRSCHGGPEVLDWSVEIKPKSGGYTG